MGGRGSAQSPLLVGTSYAITSLSRSPALRVGGDARVATTVCFGSNSTFLCHSEAGSERDPCGQKLRRAVRAQCRPGEPAQLQRELNGLWTRGGLMDALPFR